MLLFSYSATVIGRDVYVFGGNDGARVFNDLFVLNTQVSVLFGLFCALFLLCLY
jgi:hypothetical protein